MIETDVLNQLISSENIEINLKKEINEVLI
jgi:hypothetical protein